MTIKVEILDELWMLKLRFWLDYDCQSWDFGSTMSIKVEILVELWLLKSRFRLNLLYFDVEFQLYKYVW